MIIMLAPNSIKTGHLADLKAPAENIKHGFIKESEGKCD